MLARCALRSVLYIIKLDGSRIRERKKKENFFFFTLVINHSIYTYIHFVTLRTRVYLSLEFHRKKKLVISMRANCKIRDIPFPPLLALHLGYIYIYVCVITHT